jgi:hypothetical protein
MRMPLRVVANSARQENASRRRHRQPSTSLGAASTEYTLVGDSDGWLASWTARRGSLSGKAQALASVQAAAVTSASLTSLPLYAAGRQAEEATAVEPEVIRSLAVVSSLSLAFARDLPPKAVRSRMVTSAADFTHGDYGAR